MTTKITIGEWLGFLVYVVATLPFVVAGLVTMWKAVATSPLAGLAMIGGIVAAVAALLFALRFCIHRLLDWHSKGDA